MTSLENPDESALAPHLAARARMLDFRVAGKPATEILRGARRTQTSSSSICMTDDPAATMGANGRKLMDRAFKAIEDMSVSSRNDLKAQVILIAAYFTTLHLVHLRVAISRSPSLVSRSTQ